MTDRISAIQRCAPAVVQLVVEADGQALRSGSGFLIAPGLLTASHVISGDGWDTLRIRFDGMGPEEGIRLSAEHVREVVAHESPEAEMDFVLLRLDEPEFENRLLLELTRQLPPVGGDVVFLGFPFGLSHLVASPGTVTAVHVSGTTTVLQLDGNVNPANSGGPVIDVLTGQVVALVTRKHTGLLDDFDELSVALRQNVAFLSRQRAVVVAIGGVDPVGALAVTMRIMDRLSLSLKRSASVGIGYAHSAHHVLDALM